MKNYLPKLEEEQKIWHLSYDFVVGVDEVGRGPLAGPVVACAVAIKKDFEKELDRFLELGIKDSKKVTPKKREKIFEAIKDDKTFSYAIGIVDEKIIDEINILNASLEAMKEAVLKLNLPEKSFLLIDGREVIPDISLNQKSIIKGDAKVFSIALASIIAKVTRDRMMDEYAKKYPEYLFEKHKGYGTKLHFEAIKKHGPSKIHRKSFLH